MKVLPTSVDNIVATLKSDVVATLCQSISNVVTTLQSNFTKCLTTPCVNFASPNTLVFLESYLFGDIKHLRTLRTLNVQDPLKVEP